MSDDELVALEEAARAALGADGPWSWRPLVPDRMPLDMVFSGLASPAAILALVAAHREALALLRAAPMDVRHAVRNFSQVEEQPTCPTDCRQCAWESRRAELLGGADAR